MNIPNHWSDRLIEMGACPEAIAWARAQPNETTAWQQCARGDWMLWLLGKLSGDPGSDARKRLVLCACDCAETAAHLADGETQMAIARCLTLARDWADGGETDLDDVREASVAAVTAPDAAYAAAASAAYSAASAVAYTAALGALAATSAAHAAGLGASAVTNAAAANAAYSAANAADAAALAAANDANDAANDAAWHKALAICADIVREHYPQPPERDL